MQLEIVEALPLLEIIAARIAGGRFRGPSAFKVTDRDLPYDLELTVAFQAPSTDYPAGRYACTSVLARQRPGGDPLSSGDLRAVPISTIIERSLADFGLVVPVEPAAPGEVRIGRRRRSGEDADRAATAYAIAQVCGKQPMKAVSDELRVPLGTARRLVDEALRLGYLPPRA